jgi:hypothetical protein
MLHFVMPAFVLLENESHENRCLERENAMVFRRIELCHGDGGSQSGWLNSQVLSGCLGKSRVKFRAVTMNGVTKPNAFCHSVGYQGLRD